MNNNAEQRSDASKCSSSDNTRKQYEPSFVPDAMRIYDPLMQPAQSIHEEQNRDAKMTRASQLHPELAQQQYHQHQQCLTVAECPNNETYHWALPDEANNASIQSVSSQNRRQYSSSQPYPDPPRQDQSHSLGPQELHYIASASAQTAFDDSTACATTYHQQSSSSPRSANSLSSVHVTHSVAPSDKGDSGSNKDTGPANGRKKRKKGGTSDRIWSKRFTWSDELHRDFVSAVFDLGLKHSSPSVLKEYMEEEGSAAEDDRIETHLRKYRDSREEAKRQLLKSNADAALLCAETPPTFTTEGTTDFQQGDILHFPRLSDSEKHGLIGKAHGHLLELSSYLEELIFEQRAFESPGHHIPCSLDRGVSLVHPSVQQLLPPNPSRAGTIALPVGGAGLINHDMRDRLILQTKIRALKEHEFSKYEDSPANITKDSPSIEHAKEGESTKEENVNIEGDTFDETIADLQTVVMGPAAALSAEGTSQSQSAGEKINKSDAAMLMSSPLPCSPTESPSRRSSGFGLSTDEQLFDFLAED